MRLTLLEASKLPSVIEFRRVTDSAFSLPWNLEARRMQERGVTPRHPVRKVVNVLSTLPSFLTPRA